MVCDGSHILIWVRVGLQAETGSWQSAVWAVPRFQAAVQQTAELEESSAGGYISITHQLTDFITAQHDSSCPGMKLELEHTHSHVSQRAQR